MSAPQRDARVASNWAAPWPDPSSRAVLRPTPPTTSTCDIIEARPLSNVSGGHAHQADMAQARLFIEVLQDEMAELEALAVSIETRFTDVAEQRRRKEAHQLNPRINEVRRLLDALWHRFPAL